MTSIYAAVYVRYDEAHDDPASDILMEGSIVGAPPSIAQEGWNRWVICVLGDEEIYEISMCKRSNYHGRRTWGDADGRSKIVMAEGGPVSSNAFEMLKKVTETAVYALNEVK